MNKNRIWIIPLAVFLVFAVAAGAVFAVIYTKSMTDLRASAGRSAEAMFGEWTEIVRKIKTLESDREKEFSVEAGLDVPGEIAGLGESLKVTATAVRDPGGSESVSVSLAGKGDPARTGIMLTKDKHLTVAATLPDGQRQSVGFDVPGCADAFRKSCFNPEVDPESPFDEETFGAVLDFFEWLEAALTGKEIEVPEEDRKTAEEIGNVIRDLLEDLSKLPETEKENTGKLFAPAARVTVRLSNEKLNEAIDLIKEAASNESVRKLILSYASRLSAQIAQDGESQGNESQSDIEKALSDRIDEVLDKIGDFVRESKISVTFEAEIKDGKITSVLIRVPFEHEFETPDGGGEKEHEAVLSLRADYDCDGEKKLTAEFDACNGGNLKYKVSAVYLAEDRDDGARKVWSLTLEEDEEPGPGEDDDDGYHEKVEIKLEYDSESAEYRLTADGTEVIAGTFRSDDSSLEFTVGRANLTARSELFVYGKGLSKTEKPVAAVDIFTLRVASGDGEGKSGSNGLFGGEAEISLFELTDGDLEKFVGEEGFLASLSGFMTESFPPAVDANSFYTIEGYPVEPKSTAEKRARTVLGAYVGYLNGLGSGEITNESCYAHLFDSESALWFILTFDGKTANIYPAVSLDGVDLTGCHTASLSDGVMTIHHWKDTTPHIDCGEQIYTQNTCTECGLSVKTVTGKYKEHEYSGGGFIDTASMLNSGKKVTAHLRQCPNCGRSGLSLEKISYKYENIQGEEWLVSAGHDNDGITNLSTEKILNINGPDPEGTSTVKIADGALFQNGTDIGAIYFGKNVRSIGSRAFSGMTDLKAVMMHPGIEAIGDRAFEGTRLETIYFCGTEAEWKTVRLGDNERRLANVKIVFGCADDPSLLRSYAESNSVILKRSLGFDSVYEKTRQKVKSAAGTQAGVSAIEFSGGDWLTSNQVAYDRVTGRIAVMHGYRCHVYDSRTCAEIGMIHGYSIHAIAAGDGFLAALEDVVENGRDLTVITVYEMGTLSQYCRIRPSADTFKNGDKGFPIAICNNRLFGMPPEAQPFSFDLKSNEAGKIVKSLRIMLQTVGTGGTECITVGEDGRFVYMKAQNLILAVDSLTLQLEKGESVPSWADNALPEGAGAALIHSVKEIVDVAGKTESGGKIVTHLHFGRDGEVLVPAKNVITSPPAGYTPWDVVYMSGGTTVYTAYNSSYGFVTVFSAGGKTKTLSAVAESVMPLGDGRFLMWSAGARGLIIVDTNK
ncbi:MAG: leucine-rich repeat protein [Clostridiales bacterium]|nr:leucine-rich repeat protein [Clostridiales bacterium]